MAINIGGGITLGGGIQLDPYSYSPPSLSALVPSSSTYSNLNISGYTGSKSGTTGNFRQSFSLNTSTSGSGTLFALNSTSVGGTTLRAQIWNYDSSGVTEASTTNITGAGGIHKALCRLTDNKHLVIGVTSDYTTDRAAVVTVSGTTPTVNSWTTIVSGFNSQGNGNIVALTSTQALFFYGRSTLGGAQVVLLTVSGTDVSVGTPVNIGNTDHPSDIYSTNNMHQIQRISDTKAIICYYDYTSLSINTRVVDISSGTPVVGSEYRVTTLGRIPFSLGVLNSGVAAVAYASGEVYSSYPTGTNTNILLQPIIIDGTNVYSGGSAATISTNNYLRNMCQNGMVAVSPSELALVYTHLPTQAGVEVDPNSTRLITQLITFAGGNISGGALKAFGTDLVTLNYSGVFLGAAYDPVNHWTFAGGRYSGFDIEVAVGSLS